MSDELRGDETTTLETLERRRRRLGLAAGVALVAVIVAVTALLLSDIDRLALPAPALAGVAGLVIVGFVAYAWEREAVFSRVTRTLFEQQEREDDLVSRVNDLKSLVRTSRQLNATLAQDALYGVVLDGAMGITEAARGALWLRDGERLVVAASQGLGAPDVGIDRPVGSGEIGRVAVDGDVGLIGDGPSGVCAPIVIRGERVGVLVVERTGTSAPFSDREITLVRLFAEQAAVAVANATSYERERQRVETLVDAAEQRSDFVARMVHDLRAPLAAASGYAQLIRDRSDRLSPDQLGMAVDGVLEQTERLGAMIGEVLTASSVEAGAEVRRDPVDLAALLEEVAKVGMAAAESRGDRREIAVRDGHDAGVVLADPEALRHVFTNLVDNAMKYSPAGTGIRLMVDDLGDRVDVHVVDRGQGIAEEDLPTLFERFRQADGRRSGVGLGLYIVRTLVRAHGGEVSVRSKLGAGTAFTVDLPRRPLAEG